MQPKVQQERNPIWVRFSLGESGIDTMLDASTNGWCRGCGTEMQNEDPKDGHALNYRCCSQACKLLYGDHVGYWAVNENNGLPSLAELPTNIRDYNRQAGCPIRSKTQTYPSW